jgi:HAD superfamily hydrolase (TIGR01484 family)
MLRENKCKRLSHHKTLVKSLFLDYDGTIGPLNASRSHSQVPTETRMTLQRISMHIPIIIVSTKDLSFLIPRTPFAHAWCAIGGIERKIGNTIKEQAIPETALERIALSLQYAKSNATDADLFVEEKRDSSGRTVAFCLDWRQASETKAARAKADMIASYCEELDLKVFRYPGRPFYDVYPVRVDKGNAVREIRKELKLEDGTLYMGDSEVDNMAFSACDISLAVINDNGVKQNLACDYSVKYGEVADFLTMLLANDLFFSSSFPMITTSPRKMTED